MPSSITFGPLPARAHDRLSISSSPQSSMSSSSGSPMSTPTFDSNMTPYKDTPSVCSTSEDIVPKIEELDVELEDVKPAPLSDETPRSPTQLIHKPKRGRPRKYPISEPSISSKAPKGRSKTGCRTCRRRKKKCDETKPFCLSCQKNNVHCEGYAPKEIWRSGKEREAEARRHSFNIQPLELPSLMDAVETDVDRYLLEHFVNNASCVLSLYGQKQNPFTTILLPMAYSHPGLMHSILCLSGSHLSSLEPDAGYQDRQWYHYDKAIKHLNSELSRPPNDNHFTDSTVGQTLILFLHCICEGDVTGEYRTHMDAAKTLIMRQESPNPEFQSLLVEFFWYHYVCNSLTSLDRPAVLMMEDFRLPFMLQPEAGALIGVLDGLFGLLSKINNLRHRIRSRKAENLLPVMDFDCISDSTSIDTALRGWVCPHTKGTERYVASLLYKQCTWVYLYRTIKPSRPDPNIKQAVDDGLAYLRQLPEDGPTQSILLMPLFMLGCAAFEESQRPEIIRAFDALVKYSGLKNIRCAKVIVQEVWEMMDAGKEESWDWEQIIKNHNWDFLIT